MTADRFRNVFAQATPVIGMLHLAGADPVRRAIEELVIYEQEGISGAIVENYHGDISDVERTLEAIAIRGTPLRTGVNVLPNEFLIAYDLAKRYGASFIQLDHVAGTYTRGRLPARAYQDCRDAHSDILVLGGVWPKYYTPLPGSDLEADIRTGMARADAIVVTGMGTGKETPLEKLQEFRRIVGTSYPLIVGAGLRAGNARAQLHLADAAIVGSAFKPAGDTREQVERERVKSVMAAISDRR